MAQYKRAERVADLIRAELADILRKRIRDPRIGLLTLSGVTLSDDLRVAKVYFVEMGQDQCRPEIRAGLDRAAGFIRRELGKRIELRYVPELIFLYDPSFAYGSRIEKLIQEIHHQQEPGEPDAPEDH
jgi:ribosome-binding factor A